MKKIIVLTISALLLSLSLSACGSDRVNGDTAPTATPLATVTISPDAATGTEDGTVTDTDGVIGNGTDADGAGTGADGDMAVGTEATSPSPSATAKAK